MLESISETGYILNAECPPVVTMYILGAEEDINFPILTQRMVAIFKILE